MKCAVFSGKQEMTIEERPIPVPGPGQMVVKINYCGICGTDVEAFNHCTGTPPAPPIVLGHENVGTIYAIGPDVKGDFKVGDRVLCGPPKACPEMCPECQRGLTNLCLNGFPRTNGIGGPDGGYSQYMLVGYANNTIIVKVPEGVDLKDAVLFDVICVSLHAIRKSKFRMGDNVVVSGTGPIGLAAIQLLKAAGAGKIVALGTNPAKWPLLQEYGADYFVNAKELTGDDLRNEVKKCLGGQLAHVGYECAGNSSSIANLVYSCVKPGGQVMIAGSSMEPMPVVPGRYQITEIDIDMSFIYTEDEVEMYLTLLAGNKIRFPKMVTSVVSLEDCAEKGLLPEGRRGQIKILIDPSL